MNQKTILITMLSVCMLSLSVAVSLTLPHPQFPAPATSLLFFTTTWTFLKASQIFFVLCVLLYVFCARTLYCTMYCIKGYLTWLVTVLCPNHSVRPPPPVYLWGLIPGRTPGHSQRERHEQSYNKTYTSFILVNCVCVVISLQWPDDLHITGSHYKTLAY